MLGETMKDHFGEFIASAPRGFAGTPRRRLGNAEVVPVATKAPFKTHLMWALIVGGTGYASWKVSEWRTSLRLLEQQQGKSSGV